MELHPLFNPAAYVVADFERDRVHLHLSPAHEDDAWPALVSPDVVAPLQAIVGAVDPHLHVEVSGTPTEWTAHVTETDTATKEFPRFGGQIQRRFDFCLPAAKVAAPDAGVARRA